MICLICRRAEIVEGLTSIKFERGEFRLKVRNVPARVCANCGEAYVDEETAAELLKGVDVVYKTGVLEGEIDFERVCVK